MNFKRLITVLAVAAMLLSLLCACSNDTQGSTEAPTTENTAATLPSTEATTAPTVDSSKTEYTVTVVDATGSPVGGVTLQFCDEANCKLPVSTDENGVVTVSYAPSEYHVTLIELPEGYTSAETEFYFDGATEMTIELTAGD